jgi:hypothetical protein
MKHLSVADVARLRGTTHSAAWKWLTRNAGRHFRFVGGRRVVSCDVYRRLAEASYVDDTLEKLRKEVAELRDQLDEQTRRIDAIVRRPR